MGRIKGLRIVKKFSDRGMSFEINFKSPFAKEEKEIIKNYVRSMMQTDYSGKCINILKQNGRILFIGNEKHVLNVMYMSEMRL